jgi:hypothetical protein
MATPSFIHYGAEQIKAALPLLSQRERAELDLILARMPKPATDLLADPNCFPEQVAYALDRSALLVLFCTRRAAKSFSFGLRCFTDGQSWPKGNYLFLGLTREEAKRIFWKDVLKELDEKHGLNADFNESSLTCTLSNGATIYIGAADANEQEWRKLLGQKYRDVFVDEAQDWKLDLFELVYSTLKAACVDHKGSITLAGTPGIKRTGFYYDLTKNSVAGTIRPGSVPGWKMHSWTTLQNTARMPSGETMAERWTADLAEMRAAHPGIEETPAYRRNFKGEWVVEDDALVYRYNAAKNGWNGVLPVYDRGGWHHVLAVDLGYNDDTSLTRMSYHDFDPNLYIRRSSKKPRLDISAVAEWIKAEQKIEPTEITVIDGSNKQAVAEMQNRHGLALHPADKTGKPDFIELMNAEFIMGRIKVDEENCKPLVEEWEGLIWNDRTTKREEHPACANHCTDGGLYGWRYCYQYTSKPLVAKVRPGSEEWYAAEQKRMIDQARGMIERERDAKNNDIFGGLGLGEFDWG